MMHVIYLLIRATFSQKTHNALKLNYLFVFHSPKKKEEEEEKRDERGMIKTICNNIKHII